MAGCCAMLRGDLKTALDIYYTVIQDFNDFELVALFVTPGARDATGNLIDTSLFSAKSIVDLLMYLDEVEADCSNRFNIHLID